jgi:hypothetical protein
VSNKLGTQGTALAATVYIKAKRTGLLNLQTLVAGSGTPRADNVCRGHYRGYGAPYVIEGTYGHT